MKQSLLHPDSTLLMRPADGGPEKQQDLAMCVHCGRHWLIGDAIARQLRADLDISQKFGFCSRCGGIHCPGSACAVCVPREQRLENLEAGLPALAPRPASISTCGLVLDL